MRILRRILRDTLRSSPSRNTSAPGRLPIDRTAARSASNFSPGKHEADFTREAREVARLPQQHRIRLLDEPPLQIAVREVAAVPILIEARHHAARLAMQMDVVL